MEDEKGLCESSSNRGGREKGSPKPSSSSKSKKRRGRKETTAVADGPKPRTGMEGMNASSSSAPKLVKHPLEIPVVLVEVLRHVEQVDDLKSFREVSKLWLKESLGKWRNVAVFRLNEDSEKALKLTLGLEVKASDVATHENKSIPTIYRFLEKPFKNYRLAGRYIFPPALPPLKDELCFWEHCGPFIEFLDIQKACVFKNGLEYEGLKWIFGTCPNLEEFKMTPYKNKCIGETEANIGGGFLDDLEEKEGQGTDEEVEEEGYWNWDSDSDSEDFTDEREHSGGEEVDGSDSDGGDEDSEESNHSDNEIFVEEANEPVQHEAVAEVNVNVNEIPAETEKEADDLLLVASNFKSLTISAANIKNTNGRYLELFLNDPVLSSKLFKLIPTLKNFCLNTVTSYTQLMNSLEKGAAGEKPIPLEKFSCAQDRGLEFNGTRRLLCLLEYLNKMEDCSSLKEIDLFLKRFRDDEDIEDEWMNIFKQVLNKIKDTIKKMTLSFSYSVYDDFTPHCTFNLFNYHFTELTSLSVKLWHDGGRMPDYCFFDFSVLRGTPSLKYFSFEFDFNKTHPGDYTAWPMEDMLQAEDLLGKRERFIHRIMPRGAPPPPPPIILKEDEISLDELREFHFKGVFMPQAFELLGKWMKNLEVIETIFEKDTFSMPFKLWKKSLKKVTALMYGEEGTHDTEISKRRVAKQRKRNPGVEIERKMNGQLMD